MIREATAKDIPYILDLYRAGLEELGESNIIESMLLRKIVNSFHLAPCFLLEKCGTMVGMAGFTVVTSSQNGTASLADYMFYIKPEHRNIKAIKSLVVEAVKFSNENDLPLRLDFVTDASVASKARLAEMCGLTVKGVICEYRKAV